MVTHWFGKMFDLWHSPCKGKQCGIHKNIFWSLTNMFFKIVSGLCMSDQEAEVSEPLSGALVGSLKHQLQFEIQS